MIDPPAVLPEEIVDRFYRWYLANPRANLAKRAFRKNLYLTAGLIQEIEEGIGKGVIRVDPFFCSANIPEAITIQEVLIDGDQARVLLQFGDAVEIWVLLVVEEGEWRIAKIECRKAEPV